MAKANEKKRKNNNSNGKSLTKKKKAIKWRSMKVLQCVYCDRSEDDGRNSHGMLHSYCVFDVVRNLLVVVRLKLHCVKRVNFAFTDIHQAKQQQSASVCGR